MTKDERASTSSPDEGRLAWLLVKERDILIERWARRVLDDPAVPSANRLSAPALEDHIPALIGRLLARLARHPPDNWGERVGREVGGSDDLGVAHARSRFMSHFTVAEALREFSHFRAAVLELCEERAVALGLEEALLLHTTIDEMMTTSANELERTSLRAREQVMAVVAHDLRNPLNIVVGHAARLRAGVPVDGASVGVALERSAKQMTRLTEDLLVTSRLEAGHLALHRLRVDARTVVESVVAQLGQAATRKHIALSSAVPDREVAATVDLDRIEQALGNLVANAVKFTPKGGKVRVELEASETHATYRVIDTGPGTRPENRENIFRPFWQGPNAARQGVGLGLSIARGIVEAHGGEISVESSPGHGATFWFTLPLVETETPSSSFKISEGPSVPR